MTSKNSYSNPTPKKTSWGSLFLIKDCFKRTLWAPALYFVMLFFALPVTVILTLQNFNLHRYEPEDFSPYLISDLHRTFSFIFGTGNGWIGIIFIITAFVSALTVFFYLHKKKRVDFFHSLPIKRETFFISNYLTGILFILIPYVINLFLAITAVFSFGYGSYLSLLSLVLAAFQHLLLYILVYSLGIATAMLTGNFIIHGLLYAFLLILGPALIGIYAAIMDIFYPTFYEESVPLLTWLGNSSPLAKYIEMIATNYLTATEICFVLLAIFALIFIALLLYKKRPSDSAGQALAFSKTKPLFQYLITFVLSIYMGFVFYSLGGSSLPWLFFGILCGGLIISRIIEIIYAFDFHAIKKNLLPMGIFLVVLCGLFVIPIYDLTGFNSYLPAEDKVSAIKLDVAQSYANLEGNYYYYSSRPENSFAKSNKYLLTEKENVAAAYQIATIAYEQKEDLDLYNREKTRVIVCYQLENGKKVYRQYYGIPIQQIQHQVSAILASTEFKENFYHLDNLTGANTDFENLRIFGANQSYSYLVENFSSRQKNNVITGLKTDITNMTQEQWETELPLGYLRIDVTAARPGNPNATKPYYMRYSYFEPNHDYTVSLPIYPCYKNTLNALEASGISLTDVLPHRDNIDYIIEYTKPIFEEEGILADITTDITIEENEFKSDHTTISRQEQRTITNRAEIEKIIETTFPIEAFENHPFLNYQSNPSYTVYYRQEADAGEDITWTVDRAAILP